MALNTALLRTSSFSVAPSNNGQKESLMKLEDKKRVLREMVLARRFEERCYQAYIERKIGGFLHLYPGQEACCQGVMEAARPGAI